MLCSELSLKLLFLHEKKKKKNKYSTFFASELNCSKCVKGS